MQARAPSPFTIRWRANAVAAWRLTTAWPTAYGKWREERRQRSLGNKATDSCLGCLFFGVLFVFIPIMLFLLVEAAVVVYASLVSAIWGMGVISDRFRGSEPIGPSASGDLPSSQPEEASQRAKSP